MSLTNAIVNKVYHSLAEFEKRRFQKGVMPLLGSTRLIKNKTIYAHDKAYQFMQLGLLIFLFLPAYMVSHLLTENNANGILASVLSIVSMVYVISVTLLYAVDLNTVECYLKDYKKSNYYLATKEERKSIPRDAGLIGEYKGYVLSRTLTVPHKTLHNVCIPMRNGNFQEVDTIIVTPNMVYVVECKNRGGVFAGSYDSEKWVQHIGRQTHETENIYLQNQKHVSALQDFLVDKGIMDNKANVCKNVVFTTGDMKLPKHNVPANFVWGNMNKIRKFIQSNSSNIGIEDDGIMNAIYEALLPYALYTKNEREHMMEIRTIKSEAKAFTNHTINPEQISKGVSKERVEEYKTLTQDSEAELFLDKVVKAACAVTLFLLLVSTMS